MNRLLIPNTTQVPNVLLDEVIPKLPPGAVRVLLAIVRKTYGFQKSSDCISYSQLQRLTGLSREGVNVGVKKINEKFRSLLKINPGAKGKGASEYSLDLDVSTGQLVRKDDHSDILTSQFRTKRVVRKVDSPKPIRSQNQEEGAKAAPSPPNDFDPRVKDFFAWWDKEYKKRFSASYVFAGGKDGANIKRLLRIYDLPKLFELALRLLDSSDPWVQEHGGCTLGVLTSQINKLNSTSSRSRPRRELPR